MIKNWFLSTAVLFSSLLTMGQNTDEVILTINDSPIYKSEFEYIFKKNNKDTSISNEDLDEYVDLFINFKLKVKEAEALGLDKAEKFQKELAGYRKQLAKPYLSDSELTDELVKEAYDRTVNEVKASHILIKLAEDASPADTLKAYEKALRVRKELGNSRVKFEDLARKYSDDPSAKDNGGSLGYFSAFQMVYPFEQGAYTTPIGEISEPVRTSYGYHLIKVDNKRKALGKVRLSHIMISTQNKDDNQKKQAAEKAKEIYKQLQEGGEFEDLARRYSDDQSSASKGGAMPWLESGKTVEEFEAKAFALKNDGDISEPFETEFGWHIIRREAYRPVSDYETMEAGLRRKIQRDIRAQNTEKMFVAKKKKEMGYKLYKSGLKNVTYALDSSVFKENKMFTSKVDLDKKLFRLDGKVFKNKDYIAWLRNNAQPVEGLSWSEWNSKSFQSFISNFVYKYIDENLEETQPEFKALMNEYRDGILLFELTDSMVWSKAVKDTAGLEAFYEEHKNEYVWEERAEAIVYTCANKDYASKVLELLNKQKTPEEIEETIRKESSLALRVDNLKIEKGKDNKFVGYNFEIGISGPIVNNGQHFIIDTKKHLPKSIKELQEVKGAVTAAYQDSLEQQWLKKLKEKYKVVVNKDVLYTIQ